MSGKQSENEKKHWRVENASGEKKSNGGKGNESGKQSETEKKHWRIENESGQMKGNGGKGIESGKQNQNEKKHWRIENESGQKTEKKSNEGKGNESGKTKSMKAKCFEGVKRVEDNRYLRKNELKEWKKKDLSEEQGKKTGLNGEGQQEENKIEEWEEEDWMKEEPEEEDWSKDQEEESVIGIERLYRVCNGKARARYVRVGKETGVLEGAWRGKWNRKQENPSPALDWIEGDQEEKHWIEEMVGRDEEYWINEEEEEKEEVWIGEKEEQETGGESLDTEIQKGTARVKMYAVDGCTGKGITSCKESDKAHSRIGNTDEPVWRVNELLSSLVINERKDINRSFTQSMNQGLQVIKTIQVNKLYGNSISNVITQLV